MVLELRIVFRLRLSLSCMANWSVVLWSTGASLFEVFGKMDAICPSGPIPRMQTSN